MKDKQWEECIHCGKRELVWKQSIKARHCCYACCLKINYPSLSEKEIETRL